VNTASDETFEREMGCTVHEWLRWLPVAVGPHPWTRTDDGACVDVGPGRLTLAAAPATEGHRTAALASPVGTISV
jgi:hypothetical protein